MMNFEGLKKIAGQTIVRTAAVLLCGAALAVVSAQAQDEAPPAAPAGQMQGPPPGGGRGMRMDPDKMVERLTKALALTPDQATQIKATLTAQQAKMESLRSNSSASREDRRAQMMAMHEDTESKIKAVLTADQKVKYDEIQARMRERMQDRGAGGGDHSAPPPPPPGM